MSAHAGLPTSRAGDRSVSFSEATRLWAKVGVLSFGGAAGQIAMLHRFVVDEWRWLDERTFLNALNYCTLLPGPEAQQLATYIGWRLHGIRGGLVAGLLFVVPGALVMLLLSWLYVAGTGSRMVDGLFLGIKAAVLAIVAEALHRIGKRALKRPALVAVAVITFAAILFADLPFPLVIVAAALVGYVCGRRVPAALGLAPHQATQGAPISSDRHASVLGLSLLCAVAWWLPVGIAALAFGRSHVLVDLGLFFSKLAVVTFGGAYAVLAYLAEAAVDSKHWLRPGEMVDGLGLAETTPGPTILVNQFVGFLAAYRVPQPFTPLLAGMLGALMTSWVTFAPSFLWIFAGAPHLERIVGNRRLAGALACITAAVVGVIATLAVRFGLQILFAMVGEVRLGPLAAPWPVFASLRPAMLALAGLAALLLFRLHLGVVATVALAALAGLTLSLVAPPWG